MFAAMLGQTDVLMHIKGLSDSLLSGTNSYGMNPAHYAALYNQSATLSMLWHNCPTLFYEKNFWGNTPAEEAKRYGNEETKRTLTSMVKYRACPSEKPNKLWSYIAMLSYRASGTFLSQILLQCRSEHMSSYFPDWPKAIESIDCKRLYEILWDIWKHRRQVT
jgi:hypothetical protein